MSEKTDQTYRNPEKTRQMFRDPELRGRGATTENRGRGRDLRRYSSHRSVSRWEDTGQGETGSGALRKAGQWHKRKMR